MNNRSQQKVFNSTFIKTERKFQKERKGVKMMSALSKSKINFTVIDASVISFEISSILSLEHGISIHLCSHLTALLLKIFFLMPNLNLPDFNVSFIGSHIHTDKRKQINPFLFTSSFSVLAYSFPLICFPNNCNCYLHTLQVYTQMSQLYQ